jgi:hypothetical protein
MNDNAARTEAAALWPASAAAEDEAKTLRRSELGGRAILAGWVLTMLGIVAYVLAMSRAGENAGVIDALMGQGLLGWFAGTLMLAGVGVWFAGNLTCLRAVTELPPGDED